MHIINNKTALLLTALMSGLLPLSAENEQSYSQTKSSANSNTQTSRKSSAVLPAAPTAKTDRLPVQTKTSTIESPPVRPADNGIFTLPPEKTSITFIPKFKQRINDLGAQIRLVESKGLITSGEAGAFLDRQARLLLQEAQANNQGFRTAELNALEKAITLLNADLFAATHKNSPVKPGTAEKEINDPNLIPDYPDPELKPHNLPAAEPQK